MNSYRCYAILVTSCLFITIFCAPAGLSAQVKTIDRQEDVVTVTGDAFPLFDQVPINELFLFAFDSTSATFRMIPFQIDERDTANNFVFPDSVDQVPGFDANDELVFMASDAGDRSVRWLDDESSKQFPRYEIVLSDTLDKSSIKNAWVYLYRSTTLAPDQSTDYVQYVPSPTADTAQDTVLGYDSAGNENYKVAGEKEGFFGFLSIRGQAGQNLYDREKIRGTTNSFLFPSFSEEAGFEFRNVEVIDGPVRVIRRLTLSLLGFVDAPIPFQYFRNAAVVGGTLNIESLPLGIKITSLRHSIDLSDQAAGMTFSNPVNSAVVIDGMADPGVDRQVELAPAVNWMQVTGSQGTIVSIFQVPEIGQQQQLYYKDDAQTVDDNDTGDKLSYGDAGILITGENILGEFTIALKTFFYGPNQPTSVAEQLAALEANPLQVEAVAQDFQTVPVELVSFTSSVERNDVHLLWVTAIEVDNQGFQIERRQSGSKAWERIGFVKSRTSSAGVTEYEYIDRGLLPGRYEYP
ncbi:MAG: hypothetical protein D6743_09205, partial [Calditrichaeota bacterium]